MRTFKWGIFPFVRLACRCVCAFTLVALISGCGSSADTEAHAGDDTPFNQFSFNGLTISNVMAVETPLAGGNGAVYLTIHSETTDQLVSAVSPSAALVEFHESIDDNGIMRMVPQPDGFEIPGGGMVALEQGGKHIMLTNLTAALAAGDEVELTLTFREHDPVTLSVPVMSISEMDHGEMDHKEMDHEEMDHEEMNHD